MPDTTPTSPPRRTSLLARLALAAVATLVACLISEVVVRHLLGPAMGLYPRYHTSAQYGEFTLRTIRPDSHFTHHSPDGSWTFTTNDRGLRNTTDFTYEKPVDVLRVLCLGDSHTQGYEVRQDQTFAAMLERSLAREGRKVEVLNAGVSGYSTAEALLYLENEGLKYAPDVVVLGFYANDYEDNLKADFFTLDDAGQLLLGNKRAHVPGVWVQDIIYAIPTVKWFSENSYAYTVMFDATWNFFKARLTQQAKQQVKEYAIPTKDVFSDFETDLAAALIRRMGAACRESGARFVILDIPQIEGTHQVKSSVTPELLPAVESSCDIYVSSDPLLSAYSGVAELHRPHGSRHISEITHAILGVTAAERLAEVLD